MCLLQSDRFDRGELEFGLTADLRLVAQRATGVNIVPPSNLHVGDPFYLLFEVCVSNQCRVAPS